MAETHAVDLAAPLATRRFHASARSVGQARRFLLAKLPAVWGDDVDRLVLMVSELATNAVQHAATEFEVAVRVSSDRKRVRVEVSDVAAGYPTPLEPALDALHGRGLHIVRSLADAWGIEARRDRPGKTVWFSVVRPTTLTTPAAAATRSTWNRDAW
jgi:anti-sigma regulatory factor (Ser/Thr protein kinase)